jgi:Kinesin motor domain
MQYGQTGSGKTYTIIGHEDDEGAENNFLPNTGFASGEDEGIVSRSLAYIFSQVEARNAAAGEGGEADLASSGSSGSGLSLASQGSSSATATIVGDGCKYSIRASYSEIYNEALYDLLCFDQRQLSLRWDPVKGFHAPELTLQECATLQDAQDVVACGLRHRRVGSHSLNLESSRSHAILTIYIDAVPVRPEAADFGSTRMGKVVFVDLAGSERLKDSHSEGIAMRETASINRSLFMLGKVISCLASGAKGSVVPYRESKLTKLLMDSLGGSALSLMIACCSPSVAHLEETLSTLSYATRAKNIKNAPAVQMDPQQAALAALRREIKVLRAENAFLRDQLMLANAGGGGLAGSEAAAAGILTAGGDTPNASAAGLLPLPSSSASHYSPGSSPSPLPAHSVMLPVPNALQEELSRRLNDAQRLLGTLSSENSRLAAENERLRAGGLQVAGEYSGAVEEIEWLRSKLARLEVTLMGVAGAEGTTNQVLVPNGEQDLPLPLPVLVQEKKDDVSNQNENGSHLKRALPNSPIKENKVLSKESKKSPPTVPGAEAEEAGKMMPDNEKDEVGLVLTKEKLVAKARATPLPD